MPALTTDTVPTTCGLAASKSANLPKIYGENRFRQFARLSWRALAGGVLAVMLPAVWAGIPLQSALPWGSVPPSPNLASLAAVPSGIYRPSQDSWQRALDARQSVRWQQVELARILADSTWPGLTVWCDRRVDKSRVIDLELRDQPVRDVLAALARQAGAAVLLHEGLVALVPAEQSTPLFVLLADARRQAEALESAARRDALLQATPRRWERLSQPADLFQAWTQALPGTWQSDALPYDVWDAGQLPAWPLVQQLALLAFGFNQRLIVSVDSGGPRWQLEPLTDDTACEIQLDDAFHRSQLQKSGERLSGEFPGVQRLARGTGGSAARPRLSGPLSELSRLIDQWESQRPRPAAQGGGESRYTVKLMGQPAEAVLRFLATETQRQVRFAPELTAAQLERPIVLDAKDWTLAELFREIGQQAGVKIQVDATRVDVRLPDPPEIPLDR